KDGAGEFEALRCGTRIVEARRTLHRAGDRPDDKVTLFDGWALRVRILPDGRRQLLDVLLSRHAIRPAAPPSDRPPFPPQALTAVSLCVCDRSRLAAFLNDRPALLWRAGGMMTRELAALDRQLAMIGRHSARERVADLLLTIYLRLHERGAAEGLRFHLPLR